MAKLFEIVVSNPFQSSPSSAILVPFCSRITPLVFFFLSKPLFLGFPTLKPQFRPSKKWLEISWSSFFYDWLTGAWAYTSNDLKFKADDNTSTLAESKENFSSSGWSVMEYRGKRHVFSFAFFFFTFKNSRDLDHGITQFVLDINIQFIKIRRSGKEKCRLRELKIPFLYILYFGQWQLNGIFFCKQLLSNMETWVTQALPWHSPCSFSVTQPTTSWFCSCRVSLTSCWRCLYFSYRRRLGRGLELESTLCLLCGLITWGWVFRESSKLMSLWCLTVERSSRQFH